MSGDIPPELGSLFNLTWLSFRHNDLSGCVLGNLEDQLASNTELGDLPFC